MVLDETGKKFSKRLHGANVLDWREDGYLPETMINYIALLGWTSEEEGREFFAGRPQTSVFPQTPDQSPARFDRKTGLAERPAYPHADAGGRATGYFRSCAPTGSTWTAAPEWLTAMATICQEKIPTLNHIVPFTDFFFLDVETYDAKGAQKYFQQPDSRVWVQTVLACMESVEDWSHDALKASFERAAEAANIKIGALVNTTRLALTGKTVGPGLYELAELLGREQGIARIKSALSHIDMSEGSES